MTGEQDTVARLRHQIAVLTWALQLHHKPAPQGRPRTRVMYYFNDEQHRLELMVLGAVDSYEVVEGNHGRNCVFLLVYEGDPTRPKP